MALLDRVQKDMVEAMKAKDEVRLGAVRMVKAALLKYKADKMKEADEAAEMDILRMLLKQRAESAEMFRSGGRPELAQKEDAEAKVLEAYLPARATDEEMDAAIAAAVEATPGASLKQMGQVVAAARARLAGRFIDGKALADRVRARLS
jgi:uncharacterized protein YqeY